MERNDGSTARAKRRLAKMKPCRCGAMIQGNSTRCRKCNMSGVGAATHKPMPPDRTPPPVLFTGLRGPGGEMEAMLVDLKKNNKQKP